MYALQESLVVLYTSHLNQTELFIDFLIQQLSVRERPKCLIIHSNRLELDDNEVDVLNILMYAWKKHFLDFSVMANNISNERIASLIYNFNPFENIVYRKKLNDNAEIFPDKLRNAYGYPFKTLYESDLLSNLHIYVRKIKNLKFTQTKTFSSNCQRKF